MQNIESNFHYQSGLSYITQQIDEGKKVIIFAYSLGSEIATFLKDQLDATKS